MLTECNFNPNDGVSTEVIVNIEQSPDYVIATEDNQTINSRWFVLEDVRTRGGQYKLTLYRDTIADYWGDITHAPMFVEKGMLPITDKFIFNQEAGSFNQIRQSFQKLYDKSKTPWIVGYIPQDFEGGKISLNTLDDQVANVLTAEEFTERYGSYVNKTIYNNASSQLSFQCRVYAAGPGIETYSNNYFKFSSGGSLVNYSLVPNIFGRPIADDGYQYTALKCPNQWYISTMPEVLAKTISENVGFKNAVAEFTDNLGIQFLSPEQISDIRSLEGTVVLNSETNTYFQVRITSVSDYSTSNGTFMTEDSPVVLALSDMFTYGLTINVPNGRDPNYTFSPVQRKLNSDGMWKFFMNTNGFKLDLVPYYSNRSVEINIPAANERIHCKDQPFDVFCVPFYSNQDSSVTPVPQLDVYTNETLLVDPSVVLNLMQQFSAKLGTNAVFDIQMLPYNPCTNRYRETESGTVLASGTVYGDTPIESVETVGGQETRTTLGFMWWVPVSSFDTFIDLNYEPSTDSITKKLASQLNFVRLAANNYSTFFQFNIDKNNGLYRINIYCTYKPFSPWIKLSPEWNASSLYGNTSSQYNELGLYLGGDFSIAQSTSAWSTYQLNNKNYLSIFDRQIQHMEYQRDWGMGAQGVAAAAGTVAGGVAGAALGSMAGGIGAVPGAVLGAAGGALTGGLDVATSWITQNEAIDYTKDLFEYQLGNIKALPQGLAKTAAFTLCDTLVPTLEFWSTTDEEKTAFINKIVYNGMTVQRIDYLYNFLPQGGYFKAQLIRLPETFSGETHMANSIAKELNKGVYLT